MTMRSWFAAIPVATEADPRVVEMRQKLDAFYASTLKYGAFQEDAENPAYWAPIKAAVEETLARQGSCRVLEFGAGRSGFGSYLGKLRARVVWHVQDVTHTNEVLLRERADSVFIGDLTQVPEQYDVIFSTFVWEHITNPKTILTHLLSLLTVNGYLVLASPRYEFPFYIPPSARHYKRRRQLEIAVWILWRRLLGRWESDSRFLIHLDPAVLSAPWYRDSDAIHWPSYTDISRVLPDGYSMRRLQLAGAMSPRLRFFQRFMLLFVEIRRLRR